MQLKVFGFQTRELIPTMKALGDAASASPQGMADGIQRLSYAFGEMKSMGQVYTRQMNMIAMAGVPAWDILAKKMGVTVEQLHHRIKEGSVHAAEAIPALIAGINERFGGMMEKQARTWSGLMSTVKDNTQFAIRDIGKSFFTLAQTKLANLVDWMDTRKFQEFKQTLTGVVAEFSKFASTKFDQGFIWLKSDQFSRFVASTKEAAKWLYAIGAQSFQNVLEFLKNEQVHQFARNLASIATEAVRIAAVSFRDFTAWVNSPGAAKLAGNVRDIVRNIVWLAENFGSLAAGVVVMERLSLSSRALVPQSRRSLSAAVCSHCSIP